MADSLTDTLLPYIRVHARERAYGQRRGYRMEWFTYGDVLSLAFRFAGHLRTRGIGKGDRVMLWGENSVQWVAAFMGCAMIGAASVPMDDGGSPGFAESVVRQVQAKLLVSSRAHFQKSASIGDSILLEDLASLPEQPDFSSPAEITRDDVLQIVFTSGTTAEPKGVVITHGNVLANIAPIEEQIRSYMKYERLVHPIRFLNLLPLSHVFGQFLGMYLPPILGGTVLFQVELKPSEVISTVHRERVSVVVSVPRVLQSLRQKIERDLEDAGNLNQFRTRFRTSEGKHFLHRWWIFRDIHRQFGWKFWAFISGGASLDRETEEFWRRLGYAAIQGYGLTETTSLISVNHPFRLGQGSIGKILPGRDVKLAEDGEILVRGGGVASAYWDATGKQPVSDSEGWYRTGDIGALDKDGNLYFKGRKKEVIVTPAGTNVYPEDLENALRAQPEVRDCIVVGIERGGNAEPCAVVLLEDGTEDLRQVVDRANQNLAEYQRMHLWMQWPQQDFPRTSTQKPRRNLIREVAQQQIAGDGTGQKKIEQTPLAEMISRITGRSVRGLQKDAALDSDLGLSSLDRVELLSAVEDRYQVDLSETRFSSARTLGDLENILRGQPTPRTPHHYPGWTLHWPATWLRLAAHYLLMRPAILLLGWPRIEGREHIQGVRGPLLVISNHVADVDPGFILTALPGRFRNKVATATGGEALEALRSPPASRGMLGQVYDRLQWYLGVCLLNLFPLPRDAGFRQSFEYAGNAVDRGYSILVFPEGHHTKDGKLLPFRSGVGLLAKNLGVPVLPMRILGLFEVKQSGRRFAPPWRIRVRIGQPLTFRPEANPAEIAAQLQGAVESLAEQPQ